MYWEKNSIILREHYGGLIEEISASDEDCLPDEKIKIEKTSTGKLTFCINGIYVHSQRDPEKEAQRLVLANTSDNEDIVVILGFGLGYTAIAAARRSKVLIVAEKYKNLLKIAMENADLSDLLSKNKIIFITGGAGEGINNALDIADKIAGNKDEKCKPVVIRNKTLADLDKEWYGAVEDRIRAWASRDKVNSATLKRFGGRWVRNLSHNMNAIRDCPGISSLAGLAGDAPSASPIPVFFAAAGPSLDKIAPLLNEIRKRCIIVTVDTSLRFFSKNSICPDFVLTVDPQFWNSRHLDRCVYEHTVLVAESAVYPPSLRLPFKKTLLCGSLFPLGDYIEKQVDSKGRLGAGGSVATTAWDFAYLLGGHEYWIAGLDLSYPDLKTHFKGALFEERANTASNRFMTAETQAVRSIRSGFPFKTASASGGQILTDRRLFLYAAWFENRFRLHNKVRKLALFREGLAIAGLENESEKNLLALPERRDEIDKRIDKALSQIENIFFNTEEADQRAVRYKNACKSLINGLESIKTACENGVSIAVQALHSKVNSEQERKILKKLDEITRRITESDVKDVAGFLFPQPEELKADDEARESDPFRLYIKSSHKFFSSLAEAVEGNLKYLRGR